MVMENPNYFSKYGKDFQEKIFQALLNLLFLIISRKDKGPWPELSGEGPLMCLSTIKKSVATTM